VSGSFTSDQRAIFEAVANAQRAVLDMMKPGVAWPDCHRAAEREILQGLLDLGLLKGGSLQDMVDALLGPVFFPHGLGHLIGCDTHDVGG
jgi:Xaa-Pro dipeptidase